MIYGIPIYIINNFIFLVINLILSFHFLWDNKIKPKNIELFDFQKLVAFYILVNEFSFLVALIAWAESGMDLVSWSEAPFQQIMYIFSENSKSVARFFLLILMIVHRAKRNGKFNNR